MSPDLTGAERRQTVLEWFQASEDLRDALAEDQGAPDVQHLATLGRKVRDHLSRVVAAHGLAFD